MVNHLLPVGHFHIIFTLPHQLNDLIFYNQRKLHSVLFRSAWETIEELSGKGMSGMVATLHTWGSNLSYHPHLHCIVPKGNLLGDKWKSEELSGARFFVYVKELREKFKEKYLKNLLALIDHDLLYLDGLTINDYTIKKLRKIYQKIDRLKNWNVRLEIPLHGQVQIIEYLGRYIKRVAITNSRLSKVTKREVEFSYNVYTKQELGKAAPKGKRNTSPEKFLQQFSQHILPKYFHRVRYYGLYSFSSKRKRAEAYEAITGKLQPLYSPPLKRELLKKMLGTDPDVCESCGTYNTLTVKKLKEDLSPRFYLVGKWVRPSVKLRPALGNIIF